MHHPLGQTARERSQGLLTGVVVLALFATGAVKAATIYWADTSTNFNNASSWTGGSPGATNISAFADSSAANQPQLTADLSILGLQYDSGTDAWTLSRTGGGAKTLTLGSSGIVSNDDSVQTFSGSKLNITLGANQSFTSNSTGALSFASSLNSFSLGANTLTLTGTSTNTSNEIAKGISGTGGITKSGSGTWYLSGSGSYTGKTAINAGVLAINSETSLGGNPGSFAADQLSLNGGTLRTQSSAVTIDDTRRGITIGAGGGTFDTVTNLTIGASNVITGSGDITKTGSGTLTLQAANTHTGNLAVSAGTLATSGGSSIGDLATVTVSGGATWQTGSAETVGNISGSGNITFTASNTLTVGSASGSSFSGVISDGANTGALTKIGSGTLTLSGANTYKGTTTVNAGTLAYGASNVIGTGAVTVDGATAVLAMGSGRTDTVGTVTVANGGSITGSGSTLTSTGSFELQSGSVSANLAGTGISLNKTTGGTVTLSGANSYTGATNISTLGGATGGTLALGADGVLPGSTVNVYAGTLDVNSRTNTIGALNLGGGANGTTAAVSLTTGTLTLGGDLTYNATNNPNGATIGSGTLALGANRILNVGDSTAAATDLTVSSVISGGGYGIDKQGAGTLQLSGTNTYTGVTTLTAGTLSVGTIGNGGVAGNLGQATNAAGNIVFNGGTLQYAGSTATTDRSFTLNNATTGTIDVSNLATNLTISGSTTATTGALTKSGAGTLTLTGTNLHSGATTVAAGTLVASGNNSLGDTSGSVTVNSGATLALSAGTNITRSATLTLNGDGTGSTVGALHAAGGTGTTSQWTGSTTVNTASTITAADNLLIIGNGATGQFNTTTLTLNAGVTFHTPNAATVTPTYLPFPSYVLDPANIMVNSIITGTGGLAKTGAGTLSIVRGSGLVDNSFTGDTVITGGKLIVDGVDDHAVISSANIYIGNLGSANNDTVVLQTGQATGTASGSNLVGVFNSGTNASNSNLTIYEDGLFSMNRGSNGFVNLTLYGGHVDGGDPQTNPILSISGDILSKASAQTSLIGNGNLGIASSLLTVDTESGTTPSGVDLQIASRIQQGIGFTGAPAANVALEKTGAGTAVFSGNNTYAGITNVVGGALNIQHSSGLGQNSGTLGSTDNGTTVQSGAQLQLQGGVTIDNETLTLNGSGLSDTGALRNTGGSNTYNGVIYLNADSRINADGGTTLAITNPNGVGGTIIDGTGNPKKNITFGGDGDIAVNGGIASYIGNVIKDGSGTLTLAGANSYNSATTISAGAVKVTNNNGLAGSGVTVSSGSALQFARDAGNNNVSVVGVGATISGTGLGNGGAIENIDGDNSYAGAITLAANSRITAGTGSSLTLTGSVNGAGFTLDAGGAGDTTYNGSIGGSGTVLAKSGSGTVTLGGSSGNTLTGGVNVNDGTLQLNKTAGTDAIGNVTVTIGDGSGAANSASLLLQQSNQINDSAALTLNSDGRFDLNGQTETVGSIAGNGSIYIGTGQLIAGGNNANTIFSGSLSGTGSFTKAGTGELEIASSITFDGDFYLTAGTLNFSADSIFTATDTFYISGGYLKLTNADLTIASLHITGNTTIDFAGTASTLNVTTNLIIDSGVTVTIRNWQEAADYFWATNFWTDASKTLLVTQDQPGTTGADRIVFDDNAADPTNWTAANTRWQSWDKQITPVPEPATYGAMLLGVATAFLGWRRYRQIRIGT